MQGIQIKILIGQKIFLFTCGILFWNFPEIWFVAFSSERSRKDQVRMKPFYPVLGDSQAPASSCSYASEPVGAPAAQSRGMNLDSISLPDLLRSFKQATLSPALHFLICLGRIMLAAHPVNIF